MAISDFALVSLTEIKNFLGLTDVDTNRDAWLESEVNRTTEQLERWLDRRVRTRFYREDLDDDYETQTFYLKNTPVVAVQNLYRDKDRTFSTDALIADTEYSVFDDRVELATSSYGYGYGYGSRYFNDTDRLRTVRVEYVAGWGYIEIPFERQRIDLTETTGGDILTFYLNSGIKTPAEIVDDLNIELNTQGDNERVVSFDWRTHTFKIAQEDGDLVLITSEAGTFEDTVSALPLLGFLDSKTYDSSPATGDPVTLGIPDDLKGVVFDLIANRYDMNAYGDERRGIQSKRLGDFQIQYADTSAEAMAMEFSEPIMSILTQYRRWTIV